MSEESFKDILNEMTKEELIFWIRERVFGQRPKRSWLLFYRWRTGIKKLQKDEEYAILEYSKIDFSERDSLARACNESSSSQEKLKILKLMEPYDLALTSHIEAYDRFRRRQKKLDKLYAQIDIRLIISQLNLLLVVVSNQ